MSNDAPSPIIDSDRAWVKKQIDEYVETNGRLPTFKYDAPLVLITAQGRKSGEWRRTCLIGASDADGADANNADANNADANNADVVIVASMGGAPEHPTWYLNLLANPRVWVQQGAESFWTVAHTANAQEKPRLWQKMVGLYPEYADYQVKTDRDIPVVILSREESK